MFKLNNDFLGLFLFVLSVTGKYFIQFVGSNVNWVMIIHYLVLNFICNLSFLFTVCRGSIVDPKILVVGS